ncbi:MAG: HipA domain-containing protein [Porphyromonadaceae bacterium]|nr:HipA domain-containing protein [Porphyromonadaceae bacterium]
MVVAARARGGGIVGGGRCLYCYGELKEGERNFHPGCARRMFGSPIVPQLPYVRKDVENLAKEVVRSSITVPGVQAKLSVELSGSRKDPARFTIVGLWGKYILKPQTENYEHLPEIEDLTMHLAQIAGLSTAYHSLFRFADGELCYLTKRFDRLKNGKKVAVEDMCQLTGRLTELKYKGSYEQIAKTVMKYAASPLISVETFWEMVIFSWLTGNSDMHLKNFSLWDPFFSGDYMMAPAYDLLSTWMVMEDKEELALTLNAKKRKLGRQDFTVAMRRSGLNDKVMDKLFILFLAVGRRWMDFIDKAFIPDSMKADYKRLIEERLSRLEP